jgi:tetratricopeptide (TPR) repeat protein
VDDVSSQLSIQILAGSQGGVDGEKHVTPELAPVAEITTADLQAFQAYQQGLEAERRFRMVEAKAQYERAVLLDPGFALAHMRLAGREMEDGNHSKALEALYLAHQNLTAASDRDRLLVDGLIAWRAQEDRETAREKFREIVLKYPDDKEGRSFLWQLSEGDERLQLIEEAIRLDPFYGVAYNQLGYHLADVKADFDAAHDAIDRYAELEPDEPNPHDSRGEIYEKASEFESARESYRKALEIEPAFLPSLEHLTRSYLKQGQPQAAREELERYEPGPSPEAQAHVRVLIGDTHVFEGSFEDARTAYYDAAQIGVVAQRPELRIQGLIAVAQLALELGRYEEVEQTTDVLYGIDPFNGETLGFAFAALGEQKKLDELDELHEYVIRLVGETTAVRELGMGRWTADALNAKSSYYRGDLSVVVETVDRIREEAGAPSDVFIWWEDVVAHLELGNGARALALVENLWGRLRGESRYHVLIQLRALYECGRAHEVLGQPAEAVAAYEALVAQLDESIDQLPRLRDAPERLARLQASG